MAEAFVGEAKQIALTWASGSFTSNAFALAGYRSLGVILPPITSGFLAFQAAPSGSPALGNMPATDGPYAPVYDKAAGLISALTPGGTGGVALDSNFLDALKGYSGPVVISGAQQTAARTVWVHLKG